MIDERREWGGPVRTAPYLAYGVTTATPLLKFFALPSGR
jgi:hypothetical protein